MSNGSAMRVLTDTHTDSSVFITSTADAGGKKMFMLDRMVALTVKSKRAFLDL